MKTPIPRAMYIHVIFGSTVSGKKAIAINIPTDTVDRYIAIINDLIDFGALEYAYSRPATDARHSERAIKTYAGACKSTDTLLGTFPFIQLIARG